MRVRNKKTHIESCVYRFGAVTRGCAVYLSFSPLFESITCVFFFSDMMEMKLLGFQIGRKEGRIRAYKVYLQMCSRTSAEQTSAEQAPASVSACETTARPSRAARSWSLPKLLPLSKTLSDRHLLNSFLLSEWKRRHFPGHLHPFPTPPKDCRNRTIWCCPSPLLHPQMEWWAWNTLRTRRKEWKQREKREEATIEILWLKKKTVDDYGI